MGRRYTMNKLKKRLYTMYIVYIVALFSIAKKSRISNVAFLFHKYSFFLFSCFVFVFFFFSEKVQSSRCLIVRFQNEQVILHYYRLIAVVKKKKKFRNQRNDRQIDWTYCYGMTLEQFSRYRIFFCFLSFSFTSVTHFDFKYHLQTRSNVQTLNMYFFKQCICWKCSRISKVFIDYCKRVRWISFCTDDDATTTTTLRYR